MPTGREARPTRSIRYRLLAIALLPTLVILPILLGVTMVRWNAKFDAVLVSKVNGDLTIAHQYLSRILENTGEHITALGRSAEFRDAVAGQAGTVGTLQALLSNARSSQSLDFLYMADSTGRVIAWAEPGAPDRVDMSWPVLADALGGRTTTAIDIFPASLLAGFSPVLAQRAEFDLIATPNAVPTQASQSTNGMVVHSASSVTLADGGKGVLVGGILLNRNLEFIDTINDLVYREASLPEGSQGTATLFLDDVRVSTNVRLFEGRRALGTRVSAAVRRLVLEQGQVWLDRAFVVNDWYISAYEPIVDSFGKRVGMLYVGFLETPFARSKIASVVAILAAFLAVTLASVPLFLQWARSIFKPLEKMADTITLVEAGNLGARTAISDVGDEISRVAAHLDDLLDRLQARDRELRDWNEELNSRVDIRTRELQETNRRLEAMTKQLVMAEKLAAIGEITAGVAHEINNPIAVIQGNLEVLRAIMGERAGEAETELRLIDEQTERMTQIVTRLLQFARPEEYSGTTADSLPGDVISDCLPLVRHMVRKNEIMVERHDNASRHAGMNRTELQQVLVNLMVNAIHAMQEGGKLTLSSSDAERDGSPGVSIEVTDTGSGIDPKILDRIFDPFFTTKRGAGTGLGLSITHMLVSQHGGTITAHSVKGEGTSFRIWLPEAG